MPRPETTPAKVLIVDDEPTIAEVLTRYLDRAGFETRSASDGPAAVAAVLEDPPDLVVLDVMLPGFDGLEVMRRIHEGTTRRVAVILLTAKGEEADRLVGLRRGADDYVVKPFSPRELVARAEAVLRRDRHTADTGSAPLRFGDLEIDPGGRAVTVGRREIDLTPREFDLLCFLAENPGQAFSRDTLMDRVWRFADYSDATTVTVHVRRLRAKIEPDPAQPRYVQTVWGVGYRFRPEGS